MTLHLLCLLACFIYVVYGACPNGCNGHGTCHEGAVCICYDEWDGGNADCSARVCQYGNSWVDKAYADGVAHQLAECSGIGVCDRDTGLCDCPYGYSGAGCQRMTCLDDCSGRGICLTISEIAKHYGPDYDSSTVYTGDGIGIAYSQWDKDMTSACVCDAGYTGPNCGKRLCPKGDDPVTINQNDQEIKMTVWGTDGYDTGVLKLQFQGVSIPITLTNINANSCSADFSAPKSPFGTVQCTVSKYTDNYDYQIRIQFKITKWPTKPLYNNLYTNDGSIELTALFCDFTSVTTVSGIKDSYCSFAYVQNTNLKEYEFCSNRGTCDYSTGLCHCISGYGGADCSESTGLYTSTSLTTPVMEIEAEGYDFVSSVLQINAFRAPSSDFNFIECTANGGTSESESVFAVRGDGYVSIDRLTTNLGGMVVEENGIAVKEGGVTISGSGLSISSDSQTEPVLSVTSEYAGSLPSTYDAVLLQTSSSTTNHYMIKATNQNDEVFSVKANGFVNIYNGFQATQGITIESDGLVVTGGVTVRSGKLIVNQDGIEVTGGVSLNTQGLRITAGGAQVFGGGMSIHSGGVDITGGFSVMSRGFSITGGMSILSGGLQVTGGLTVLDGAVVSNDGMTIAENGLIINNGGFTVASGGVEIYNTGLTINSGGMSVTGGLTVHNSGLVVTGGGTIIGSGMAVTNGVTVYNGGIIANTATLQNLVANDGMTINSAGLNVNGGMTVQGTSLVAENGALVYEGFTVQTGGMFIENGGLDISGQLTVAGTAELQNVQLSDRRVKTNLEPITDALQKVSRLSGVYFDWIQDESTGLYLEDEPQVGVIAQEVDSVLPEAVVNEENKNNSKKNYLKVQYHKLIPLLIEAIHELDEMVENLRTSDLSTKYKSSNNVDINERKTFEVCQNITNELDEIKDEFKEALENFNLNINQIQTRNIGLRKELDDLRQALLEEDGVHIGSDTFHETDDKNRKGFLGLLQNLKLFPRNKQYAPNNV